MTVTEELQPCDSTKPAGILEDNDGNGSSSRLIKVGWVFFLGVILGIVAWRSNPPAVPDVPWGIVMITLIVVGGGAVGKWMELGGTLQGLMSGGLPGKGGK